MTHQKDWHEFKLHDPAPRRSSIFGNPIMSSCHVMSCRVVLCQRLMHDCYWRPPWSPHYRSHYHFIIIISIIAFLFLFRICVIMMLFLLFVLLWYRTRNLGCSGILDNPNIRTGAIIIGQRYFDLRRRWFRRCGRSVDSNVDSNY